MGKKERRDAKIRNNPRDVAFSDALQWLSDQGFVLERVQGSHHILRHPHTGVKLNFQPDRAGKAKPYQVKQAIQAIDQDGG